MESKLAYLVDLGVILLAANIGGLISKKFKQPAVLGQIIIGIVLGMGIIHKTELITNVGEIGVIFLMFIAGLETDVEELKSSLNCSSMIALGGVVAPAALVFLGVYYIVGSSFQSSVFLAVVATATSVSISVQTLREIGKLRTKQGITILGAAIIDDVVGIILLTLVVGVISPNAGGSLLMVIGKILGFFLITIVLGKIITYVIGMYNDMLQLEDKVVTYAIVICFALAFISEELGVASITGAFFSGVVFSMTRHRHKVAHEINRIATLFFTPVFFVGIGMGVDLGAAIGALGIGAVLIVMGSLGKIIGSGTGAKMTGFTGPQALQIGFGMVPRAEVAIIIANLGVTLQLITNSELSAVILMVVVTTLTTPSLLKWSFEREARLAPSK